MPTFSDISRIPDFNSQQYGALLEKAQQRHLAPNVVDASLLEAVNSGKSFAEAASMVAAEIPKMSYPRAESALDLSNWPAMPAPGALVMAFITEFAAENRQKNRELAWAQTEAVAASMKEEAGKMRDMAITQLVIGLTGAALSIAGGIAQAKVAASGKGLGDGASMLQSAKAQGVGTAIGGGARVFDAAGQFAGAMFQAEFKEMEADQEKMRAMRDSIKDFSEGLGALIQKSLSTSDNLQQGRNQVLARILA